MSRVLTKEEIEALLASGPFEPAPTERLQLVVEAGRAELPFEDLAALRPGSLIPLHGAAGDPLEVVANGTTVAYGHLAKRRGRSYVRIVSLAQAGSTTERSAR